MSIPETKSRNRILIILFLGVLMGAMDVAIVGPALPAIQKTFQVDSRSLAWVFSVFVLFNLIGTPLIAKLSDRFGRRKIYLLDVGLFTAGSLWVAISPAFGWLLVGRGIQGFAAGGLFPVAAAVIGDTFPPEKRGRSLGMIGAVFGIAFLIGPLLGGVLLLAGWEWLFLVNLPVAVAVIWMGLKALPVDHPAAHIRLDWAGMATLGGALASLAFGINRIETDDIFSSLRSNTVWPFLLGFVLLGVGFIWREQQAQDPVLRLELFRNRQLNRAYALSAGAGLGEASLVFVPALAVAALGYTSSTASFLLLPFVLALAIGAPLAGRMLDRFGSRLVVVCGTTLITIGLIVLGLSSGRLGFFILSGILIAGGLAALLGAPIRYITLNEASVEDRSSAQGVTTLFASIGQLVGGVAVGAIAASRDGAAGYEVAYLATGIVMGVLIPISVGLKNRAAELASAGRSIEARGGQAPQTGG